MSDIAERLAKRSPEKRSLLIQKLKGARGEADAAPAVGAHAHGPSPEWAAFCCRPGTPGNFDAIGFAPLEVGPPGPGQIQIRTKALSLNFRDLMIAMGLYPPTPGVPSVMGSDYAGVVTACGEGVEDLREGDEVMALSAGHFTPDGRIVEASGLFSVAPLPPPPRPSAPAGQIGEASHFCSVLNVSARQAVLKAENISFAEAACGRSRSG